MKFKLIQTESEYEEALALAESLMEAAPGTAEADDLEVLSVLIEKYEQEHYPIEYPDPISAIKFRMQQQGLTQKDLEPYIGSQPKVSAVLNGKRELSKEMIRKLHAGLGIPYEVLLQKPGASLEEQKYFPADFPFKEMVENGYFPGFTQLRQARTLAEDLLENLFAVFKAQPASPIYCKSIERAIDENALLAWQARILNLVLEQELPQFHLENLDDGFFDGLLRFSTYEKGLQLVREHLNKAGIHFVILKHLPHTYLDGASFMAQSGHPVVAMTLRQDRLDNFWFTLFHELAHVRLHLAQNPGVAFFDDTEGDGKTNSSPYELEANQFARDWMVPKDVWQERIQPQLYAMVEHDVLKVSQALKIHPAFLAGRIRHERQDYLVFSDLVGYKKVREQFAEYRVVE